MTAENKNALLYICTLVEFLSRKLKRPHREILDRISRQTFRRLMRDAGVNHCLPLEQVADELIPQLELTEGRYDVSAKCRYKLPSPETVGGLYQRLILAVLHEADLYDTFRSVFTSFIPEKVADINSAFYYANPDYIRASYEAGHVLA